MISKKGLYTGSFDPLTRGHLDIIKRAAKLVDTLYVGIFVNLSKSGLFSIEERQEMLVTAVADLDNVQVVVEQQRLVVDVARDLGVAVLIRGIRNTEDLSYEANLEFFNHHLNQELETIYLLARPDLAPVSSSRIRELLAFSGDISPFVPQAVLEKIKEKNEGN